MVPSKGMILPLATTRLCWTQYKTAQTGHCQTREENSICRGRGGPYILRQEASMYGMMYIREPMKTILLPLLNQLSSGGN